MNSQQFFCHSFKDLTSTPFSIADYSRLKFGSDLAAKRLGYELADKFVAAHAELLLANRILVIPSPYNEIKNAAGVMTEHLVKRLNHHLVALKGESVETDIIKRKVSYINDYGFLSKDQRKGLIGNDSFYLNKDFYQDKLLIFVDDVIISGAHEERLEEVLKENEIENKRFYLYYAKYEGNDPKIEAELNFCAVKNLEDYNEILKEKNSRVIVRPLKYLLGHVEFGEFIAQAHSRHVEEIYHGALAEKYYTIPKFQENFQKLVKAFDKC